MQRFQFFRYIASGATVLALCFFFGFCGHQEAKAELPAALAGPAGTIDVDIEIGSQDDYRLDGRAVKDSESLHTEIETVAGKLPGVRFFIWARPDQHFSEVTKVLAECVRGVGKKWSEVDFIAEPRTADPRRRARLIADAARLVQPPPDYRPALPISIVKVHVDFIGTVFWNSEEISSDIRFDHLLDQVSRKDEPEFHIDSEILTPYRAVAATIAKIESHGFFKVGLVSLR